MSHSKRKEIRQQYCPAEKNPKIKEDPESSNRECPAWSFSQCDAGGAWDFAKADTAFWSEIYPCMASLGRMSWNDILVTDKKHNHSIDVASLNKCATDRLVELKLEQDAIISLSLQGTHRLYGFRSGRVFSVLWYDVDHGDNDSCVCRSRKKHT